MIGNISKSKTLKSDPLTFDMMTDEEKAAIKGEKGDKGDIGKTPSVKFEYDEETGILSCDTDGEFIPEDYVSSHKLLPKDYVGDLSELKTVDKTSIVAAINELYEKGVVKKSYVVIRGGQVNWNLQEVSDDNDNVIGSRYAQVVNVNNAVVTPNSKVTLDISSDQMVIFYEKDISFKIDNCGGVVTVYCMGSIPENDYEMQVTVTEVE